MNLETGLLKLGCNALDVASSRRTPHRQQLLDRPGEIDVTSLAKGLGVDDTVVSRST